MNQGRVARDAGRGTICAAIVLGAVLCGGAVVGLAQTKGRVTGYGIYGPDDALAKRTREIPAGKAVRFGFCFEAPIAAADGRVALTQTLQHPPALQANGIESTGYSTPRLFDVGNGIVRGCVRYQTPRGADVVAGAWTFTISDGGDDLVIERFEVK